MDGERLLTIGEAAARSGVSIRTLRHYDEIGLLSPAAISQAGYRLYGEREMRRLEQILYFRELEFPLEQIAQILSHPGYDEREAMARQLALMKKKRERLERLIERLKSAVGGEEAPEFEVFDMKQIDAMKKAYAAEAKERWGGTAAYAQSEKKRAQYGKGYEEAMCADMEALMDGFAAARGQDPAGEQVQALVEKWKACITTWCYDCTDDILAGLGQMYTADERFKKNIDRHGEGTAALMSEAIRAYVAARG